MTFVTRLTPAAAAVLLLASCGGGGGSSPPAPVVVSSSGFAVDGYLSGAAVLCDSNGNGSSDTGEISVTSNASGGYSFPAGCSAALTARGGISVDTGLPFSGELKAPAGSSVITPLTTLLAAGLTQVQVKATLGLPAATDLQSVDPALKTNGVLNDALLFKQTLAVQQLLQKSTELFTGLAGASTDAVKQAVYAEVAASFATRLKTSSALSSGSAVDAAVVASLVQAAAIRAGTAAAVPAEVKAALAQVSAAALGAISADGLKAQADAILQSSEANLTAVTKANQTDTSITTFVVANLDQIKADPSALTRLLAGNLADQIKSRTPPAPTPPPASAANYLSLPGDAIGLVTGAVRTVYTLAQFQSDAGIRVSWPMAQATLLKVTLAEVGNYSIPAGQKLTAAVALTETTPTGRGEVQGYIDGVTVKRSATGLEISVPASANALVYNVSGDGKKKAVIDFANDVAGISNTLTSLAGYTNSIVLGDVVNYAVSKIGKDFSGIGALRGKYKVTLVIDSVPLRKADGSLLPMLTVNVPTAINSSGAVVAVKSVTGAGLIGFITLSD